MKSAVDFLAKELYEKFEMKGNGKVFDELLQQAKEMEKEQIKDAYEKGKKYKKPIKDSNPIWLNSKPYKKK